jgi:hypothetical protein
MTTDGQGVAAIWQAIGTVVLFLTLAAAAWYAWETRRIAHATLEAVRASRDSIEEMRLTRDAEVRPYVIAYPSFGESSFDLVLANTGKTPAYNLRVSITPELRGDHPGAADEGYAHMISHGVPYLPPGLELRFPFARVAVGTGDSLRTPYHVQIDYTGPGKTPKPDEYDICLWLHLRWSPSGDPLVTAIITNERIRNAARRARCGE